MLQNVYNLPDLVDLALKVPEVGAVNFNILYIILQTMISELGLTDLRPWCHIKNPLLAKAALTRAKLKGTVKRSVSVASIQPQGQERDTARPSSSSDARISDSRVKKTSLQSSSEEPVEEQKVRESSSQTDDDLPPYTVEPRSRHKASQTDVIEEEAEEQPEQEDESPSHSAETEEREQDADKDSPRHPKPKHRREDKVTGKSKADDEPSKTKETEKLTLRDLKKATAAWQYTNLESRVQATEEGLMQVANIVDEIADKLKKFEPRKAPGAQRTLTSDELEDATDKKSDFEEAEEIREQDHLKLDELEIAISELQKDFEEMKSFGDELEEMKIDISSKADKKETEDALALKGDLEMLNAKVDRLEFETAIEELGEAIGLLGIKFQKKNDEWDERAKEIWEAIDGKMTRDIFESARVKTEERMTALMFGLKNLKKVVEELLYPDSCGVTRCIACRRPAGVSGDECIGTIGSPKREFKSSDESSSEGKDKLLASVATIKRLKIDEPPYCEDRDTIISVPYSSPTYNSSTDESDIAERYEMILAPIDKKTEEKTELQPVTIPLTINKRTHSRRSNETPTSKFKTKTQHRELTFTNRRLAELQKKAEKDKNEKKSVSFISENQPTQVAPNSSSDSSVVNSMIGSSHDESTFSK